MSSISKAHQRLSERLNNPRVLSNPEEFLGPNYKTVLNFWLRLDELSKEQLKVVRERYYAFFNENPSEWYKAADLARDASYEVVGANYANYAGYAVWGVTISDAACRATRELIGMHLILDQEKPLTFFEMFLGGYEHHL